MDENRPSYSLQAPAVRSSGTTMRLPSREERFPLVDDHLVEPEVTRDEIINGRRLEASPAERRHARVHLRLDYVISAHIAPGYEGGTDLLTRHDVESNFASDAAVFKEGIDPQTGTRYLEELAFEVVSEQSRRNISEKAPIMLRRGVRRVFAIFLKGGTVEEWSKAKQKFIALPSGASLRDSCLVRPLRVAALLDAARAETEVGEALIAKENAPVMAFRAEGEAKGRAEGEAKGRAEGRAEGEAKGRAEGRAEGEAKGRVEGEAKGRAEGEAKGRVEGEAKGIAKSILRILENRDLEVSISIRQQILSCHDLPTLERWLTRTLTASSSADVVAD